MYLFGGWNSKCDDSLVCGTISVCGIIQIEIGTATGPLGGLNQVKTGDKKDPVQERGGVRFFATEPAEDGGRTATAPRPKCDSIASHISARTI